MCTVDQAGAQLLRIGRRFISPMGPSHPVILQRHSRSAQSRRYLKPEFECLCRNRRGVLASAETRYLQRCPRRSPARSPLSLPLFVFLSRAGRPRGDMSTPQNPSPAALLADGLKITADLREVVVGQRVRSRRTRTAIMRPAAAFSSLRWLRETVRGLVRDWAPGGQAVAPGGAVAEPGSGGWQVERRVRG